MDKLILRWPKLFSGSVFFGDPKRITPSKGAGLNGNGWGSSSDHLFVEEGDGYGGGRGSGYNGGGRSGPSVGSAAARGGGPHYGGLK